MKVSNLTKKELIDLQETGDLDLEMVLGLGGNNCDPIPIAATENIDSVTRLKYSLASHKINEILSEEKEYSNKTIEAVIHILIEYNICYYGYIEMVIGQIFDINDTVKCYMNDTRFSMYPAKNKESVKIVL